MSFCIRKYSKSDYPILEKWFKDWGWEAWGIDSISPFAFWVFDDDKPIFFTSYYKAVGCNLAQMGISISLKDCPKLKLARAISLGLDTLFQDAQSEGIKAIRYATDLESKVMIDYFVKKGAKLIDNDALVAIKVFDENMNFFYEGN